MLRHSEVAVHLPLPDAGSTLPAAMVARGRTPPAPPMLPLLARTRSLPTSDISLDDSSAVERHDSGLADVQLSAEMLLARVRAEGLEWGDRELRGSDPDPRVLRARRRSIRSNNGNCAHGSGNAFCYGCFVDSERKASGELSVASVAESRQGSGTLESEDDGSAQQSISSSTKSKARPPIPNRPAFVNGVLLKGEAPNLLVMHRARTATGGSSSGGESSVWGDESFSTNSTISSNRSGSTNETKNNHRGGFSYSESDEESTSSSSSESSLSDSSFYDSDSEVEETDDDEPVGYMLPRTSGVRPRAVSGI